MTGHLRDRRPPVHRTTASAVSYGKARGVPAHDHLRGLQRTVGNAAVGLLLSEARAAPVGLFAPPVVQRKLLPTTDSLKSELECNGSASVRETLTTLFHRLHRAKKLRDPNGKPFKDVATAVNLVLLASRSPGKEVVFNVKLYEGIVERSSAKAADGEAPRGAVPITTEHWTALKPVVGEASDIAGRCSSGPLIEAVFGPLPDRSAPRAAFEKIAKRLAGFSSANFVVNYDSGSDATGAAGAASPGSGIIELSGSLVRDVATKKASAIGTLVHEAAHETDAKIVDLGYYGSPGFDRMLVADKLRNADHYAEVARRILGTSQYEGSAFRPKFGVLAGSTLKDVVIKNAKNANDGLEELWRFSLSIAETVLPLTVPGTDENGKRANRADTPEELRFRRELAAKVKLAYGLPAEKRPHVMTDVDRALIDTATMVLDRAFRRLSRLAKSNDPTFLERFARYKHPVDFASAAIWASGGFVADREASNKRHIALISLYYDIQGKSPYPALR